MRYGSVCSGIEAATQAWHGLGWEPQWFAEIEKFPSSVLAHRWPGVPNIGDFTIEQELAGINLLVGGTPCQSFSVAGLRKGMADDRGNLALEFLRLAGRLRPRWVVWENVPGVLSIDGGRAFGSILGGLAELGYGWAYRVLDAQHFGVAQRRRRVFVVGCLGNQSAAAAVLFERACLRGDSPPSRKTGEEVAGTIGGGAQVRGWCDDLDRAGAFVPTLTTNSHPAGSEPYIPEVAHALTSEGFDASEDGTGRGPQLVAPTINATHNPASQLGGPLVYQGHGGSVGPMGTLRAGDNVTAGVPFVVGGGSQSPRDVAPSLNSHGGRFDFDTDAFVVAPTLNANGKAAGSATQQDAEAGALVVDEAQITSHSNRSNPKPGDPLSKESRPLAFHMTQDPISGEVSHTIGSNDASTGLLTPRGGVRRLTPREYERLFGFPDDYTRIDEKTKDGPRYRALGNSMAVPVMRWIGERIAAVEAVK